jgi:hypothetical protein
MKPGISRVGMSRIAVGMEMMEEYGPPDEWERRDDTSPFYDEEYATAENERQLQEDADTLYKYAYEGLAEALAGPGYKNARGRVLTMMMEDPESFFRKAFEEIRLYEE